VPNATDESGAAEPPEIPGELPRALSRQAVDIPHFETRWLIGAVLSVPILVGAGVYWLHQQPPGSASRSAGPVVEVRLVQEPAAAPAPLIAPQPQQQASLGRPEPLIETPERPIPEETTPASPAPSATPPVQKIERAVPASMARPAVPSGAAVAFQRLLVSHIARYLRYPPGIHPNEANGIVQVMFAMRRDGTVTEMWVRSSSGHWMLDRAATDTIRRAQPLPTIPADLPDTLTILMPVSFDAR
jgi:protein TonB